MNILSIVWSLIAGACLTLSFLHCWIWFRQRPSSLSHLLFGLAALGAAANALIEQVYLHADSPIQFGRLYADQNSVIALLLLSLVWFVYVDFGTARRWLAILISVAWGLVLILNTFSHYSVVYKEITALRQATLPWGESYVLPVGVINPWKYVADVASVLILAFFVDASARLWRRGGRRRSVVVGGSVVFFIVAAGVHTPLIDAGLIQTPPIISFTFLAIIVAISSQLVTDVVRSGILAKEITASERRWQLLLENVQLLVIELDTAGKITYVNPQFLAATGYDTDRVIGRQYTAFLASDQSDDPFVRFLKGQSESFPQQSQAPIVSRLGEQRIIAWSNVRLFDREGMLRGSVSIGADVTERERAYHQIADLKERLEAENIQLQEEIIVRHEHKDLIGTSDTLRYALSRLEQVAPTDSTVLLEGETGTGKELFARSIHQMSPRRNRPLIKVNCAAIPSTLVESELFGHEKGAFTGADRQHRGKFELAAGGTIFLDEVAELPLELQPKLLRVLEEGEFERLGGIDTIRADVRVIASTNRTLVKEVQEGRFREDLFYRLHAFPISIPPLRKRTEDIHALTQMFVTIFARKIGKEIEVIPRNVMERLQAYHWPGNVRELRNVIERAVISTTGPQLQILDELKPDVTVQTLESNAGARSLAEVERAHILKVLEDTQWRIEGKGGAAEVLDLHPNTLRNRLQKLGIKRPA